MKIYVRSGLFGGAGELNRAVPLVAFSEIRLCLVMKYWIPCSKSLIELALGNIRCEDVIHFVLSQ